MVVDAECICAYAASGLTILEAPPAVPSSACCATRAERVEDTISLQGLLADIESGRVSEVFACGTAAVSSWASQGRGVRRPYRGQ